MGRRRRASCRGTGYDRNYYELVCFIEEHRSEYVHFITPHVCRHTYCSNQAKAGMNPKTLQYLMGHSDIGVTLNTYTHLGLEDAAEELRRMEEAEAARREQEKLAGKAKDSQKLFNAV